MGDSYELIPFDLKNGGEQESIYVSSFKEATKLLKKLSKEYYCVTLNVRTNKKGLL